MKLNRGLVLAAVVAVGSLGAVGFITTSTEAQAAPATEQASVTGEENASSETANQGVEKDARWGHRGHEGRRGWGWGRWGRRDHDRDGRRWWRRYW